MRLAASNFFRSANNTVSGLFKVDSEVFESVPIPGRAMPIATHITAPPLRPFLIRLPSERMSGDFDRSTASTPSLELQPSIDPVKPIYGPWTKHSTFTTTIPPRDPRGQCLPRIFFILGFFFPLLWAIGGAFLWRSVDPPCESEAGIRISLQHIATIAELRDREARWAWRCITAFAAEMLIISVVLLVLYCKHIL